MSDEFLVRDTRLPGHFWADNEVLDIYGPLLGAHGFAVYMALCRNATNGTGECRMATRKLARLLDISTGGAFNALALISKLGLIRQISAGDPRNPAIYLLADVKSLVDPLHAQLRLASVHMVNAQQTSVHGVNAIDHPVNARAHGVNAAFMGRTPNKERKTFNKTYKTKSQEGECEKCANTGFYELKNHPGKTAYCSCRTGRDLRAKERVSLTEVTR